MINCCVLLSTYNGKKYLREQLDSLLQQEEIDLYVYVRDDGSTDGTQEILMEYQDKFCSFSWYQGENIGPAYSFLELLKTSGDFEYYAFCDQDDIWYKKKLQIACNTMQEESRLEVPKLYMSTYEVVNKDLELMFIREMHFERKFTFEETILGRCPSGCTMVFNRALRDIVKIYTPKYTRMHDFWLLLSAELVGAVIYTDNNPQLKYRQHENNVIGLSISFPKYIKRLLESAINGENERQREAKELYNAYWKKIKDPKAKMNIKKILEYKKNIKNRFILIKSREFKSESTGKNILFVISVLLGVF